VGTYHRRLWANGVFALVAELLVAGYTRALVSDHVLLAAGISFVLPFVGFCGWAWFVEEKGWWRRLGFVAATAVGYAAGTAAVMTVW